MISSKRLKLATFWRQVFLRQMLATLLYSVAMSKNYIGREMQQRKQHAASSSAATDAEETLRHFLRTSFLYAKLATTYTPKSLRSLIIT